MIDVGFGREEDCDGILKIQQKSSLETLLKDGISAEEYKKTGFVELSFDKMVVRDFLIENSIIVARENSKILGYLVVVSFELLRKHGLVEFFLERAGQLEIDGQKISEIDALVFSVAVDEKCKGQGLALKMYDFLRMQKQKKFTVAVSEVLENNLPSYRLHIEKMNLEILSEYINNEGINTKIIALKNE